MLVIQLKKTDYNTKVTEIENKLNNHNHDKYITTPEFNTLAAVVFKARLAQANLITKTDFDAKLSKINRKIMENKINNLLVENELNKLKAFDFKIFYWQESISRRWYSKLFNISATKQILITSK